LTQLRNGGSDKPAEKVSERPAQSVLNPALVHDVDCDKITGNNKVAIERSKYACKILPNSIMLASFTQES